jgi:hypothetical protein
MEVCYGAAEAVHSLIRPEHWRSVERARDLAGIERVISAEPSARI